MLYRKRNVDRLRNRKDDFNFVAFSENFETHSKKGKSLKRIDSDCFSFGVLDFSQTVASKLRNFLFFVPGQQVHVLVTCRVIMETGV